jgi:transcriptional regulator with XRE-family HTH domain
MPVGQRPLVRRRLRNELRIQREDAGLSQDQVAKAMEWSLSKVIRLEAGQVGISTNDMKALLGLYQVADAGRVTFMVELARAARKQSAWWSAYRDSYTSEQLDFIGYENEAAQIECFEPIIVPGLLQTEEYMRALFEDAVAQHLDPKVVDRQVDLRLKRQEHVLGRDDPPEYVAILDESVVRRKVGGADIMADQLRSIVEVARMPNVTVQLTPLDGAVHPGLSGGSFVLLTFSDPNDQPVLEMDGPLADTVLRDDSRLLNTYQTAFERIRAAALAPTESLEMITKIADRLSD